MLFSFKLSVTSVCCLVCHEKGNCVCAIALVIPPDTLTYLLELLDMEICKYVPIKQLLAARHNLGAACALCVAS